MFHALPHPASPHSRGALHDSAFVFAGSFDDASFCRGPQCLKPVVAAFPARITTTTTTPPATTRAARPRTAAAAPRTAPATCDLDLALDDYDSAVLGDDDASSEDELPPSPRRRHSGAMSISSEDLPFCYDRDALQRATAGHRARHQRQQRQKPKLAPPRLAFAAHDTWATELDGPHMALWVPADSGHEAAPAPAPAGGLGGGSSSRQKQSAAPASRPGKDAGVPRRAVPEMEGPMMALWGI